MKILSFLLLLVLAGCFSGCRQEERETVYRPGTDLLEQAYTTFREESLSERRFKHQNIEPLIRKRMEGSSFRVEELGKSVEQRAIYQLTYGKGPVKVMLWSQMHGDESTATMALFDLFNFLEGRNDDFDTLRSLLAENTTLFFIPMLNPDGAEAFKRRNAYGFDINRDAARTASPEARILKQARDNVIPDFGFNLHDQSIYYNVKGTPKPATISVLAPAFDEEVNMNEVRKSAMKVIVGMNELLQQYIPGGVGKYDDSFYPTAFGDNFQKWGTSTILIESGGYNDDPEKQFIRKLNFMVILKALTDIATGAYQDYGETRYFDIPDNDNQLTDLLIRHLQVQRDSAAYLTDISIKQGNSSVTRDASFIEDLGDLSVLYGYEELDAEGFQWQAGKLYEQTYASAAEINQEEALSLLRKGYSAVRVASPGGEAKELPLIILYEKAYKPSRPQIGEKGTFFISKNGRPHYAVVRGKLIKL
ncbi:zinc carboxypeptidase [Anseongella ginsenosidimutans]|uniref:Zinc carboxypeptidase n=1 Tax=Anseongella ginsenosidimutans TaxID=496056 RepID=A0A4R3KT62_9SPHI|nr:M14 metallopeptidase family protein [Anseongella ginsenosidimutans]QEC53535.1 peptidase M14 [Anseongella ginsenosidimutans]TCS88438.1 zinc carboxypeptidase [Anseongella ginsenosidimutans]